MRGPVGAMKGSIRDSAESDAYAVPVPHRPFEGSPVAPTEITQLLIALRDGKRDALDALLPLVYEQLHAMAHRRLGAGPRGATLDTTALLHEAYVKLFDQSQLVWNDRKHFFAVAAMAMRQIVVDEARRRRAPKHGGHLQRVDLDASALALDAQAEELLQLDRALEDLARLDPRMAKVVEMRFFGGFSMAEIAEVLGVGERTIDRDWQRARATLYQALRESGAP
jgi:RNA polymerase sigma factor (TIGR02999 family)